MPIQDDFDNITTIVVRSAIMADPLGRADQERRLVVAQQLHKHLDVPGLDGGWVLENQEGQGEKACCISSFFLFFPSTLRLFAIAPSVMCCAS